MFIFVILLFYNFSYKTLYSKDNYFYKISHLFLDDVSHTHNMQQTRKMGTVKRKENTKELFIIGQNYLTCSFSAEKNTQVSEIYKYV